MNALNVYAFNICYEKIDTAPLPSCVWPKVPLPVEEDACCVTYKCGMCVITYVALRWQLRFLFLYMYACWLIWIVVVTYNKHIYKNKYILQSALKNVLIHQYLNVLKVKNLLKYLAMRNVDVTSGYAVSILILFPYQSYIIWNCKYHIYLYVVTVLS